MQILRARPRDFEGRRFWGDIGRRLLVSVLLFATAVSCAPPRRPLTERLQEALDARVRRSEVEGAAVAVMLPGGAIWLGTSGISHPGAPMQPDMTFAIGSITKNMVAALALQLAEEGKLSLDDPIGRWLPAYRHVNPAITMRQMLNHTSGLYMFWENQQIWDDLIRFRTRHFTPEEVLGYLNAPYYPPGGGYHYSNTGYLLAAMIIARATGSTLATEMRRRFWEPLGLRSACLPLEEPYPQNRAHVWGDNFEKDGSCRDITFLPRISHDSITYGSAGVFMTAEDLARWTHALFHGKVIGQSSLDQMRSFGPGSYGLGLGRLGFRVAGGFAAVGHGGGNIGTCAYMIHLPDYDVSIAVMVNRFGSGCESRIASDLSRITAFSLMPRAYLDFLKSPPGIAATLWILAGLAVAVHAVRKGNPLPAGIFGGLALVLGWISIDQWRPLDAVLLPLGGAVWIAGLISLVHRWVRGRRVPK